MLQRGRLCESDQKEGISRVEVAFVGRSQGGSVGRPVVLCGWVVRALLITVLALGTSAIGTARAAALVTISAGSASVVEGDSGARSVDIPVTLSAPTTTTVTVRYAVTARNATAGGLGSSSHFRTRTGTLKWAPNAKTGLTPTQKLVVVTIVPNVIVDGDEPFAVVLSNPTGGAFLDQRVGTGTIIDDDPLVGMPRVSVGDASVFAGESGTPDREALVSLTLSAPIASNVTVAYTIGGGTAIPNVDYIAKASGTVTFTAGKTLSKSLVVHVVPHATPEPSKTVSVGLSGVSSGAVLGRSTSTVTIDDDAYSGTTTGPKVAAIGDSIVFVAGGTISAALADRYQSWIVGIPGYTIGNAVPALDQQLATAPDDVVANLGTDDALEDFTGWQSNFDTLMNLLTPLHCVELVTLNDVDVDAIASHNYGTPVTIAADINRALANAVATHSNMHLIDWKTAVDADQSLVVDGIHPSDAGKQWLATHYRSAIDEDC